MHWLAAEKFAWCVCSLAELISMQMIATIGFHFLLRPCLVPNLTTRQYTKLAEA